MVANLRSWPARRWVAAAAAAVVFALAMGAPTDVIPNPLAQRVVPVAWWSYPTLAGTAILGGLVAASYVRSPVERTGGARTAGGGLLSVLAIGCPVCNKLVVLALGTSGALAVWAPLQPVLAVASVALLGWALRTRLAAEGACRLPAPTAPQQRADSGAGNQ